MGTTLNTTNATAMTAMFKASLIIALVAFATFAPALAKSYTKELDGVRVEDGCAGCLATVWPTVALCFADLVALPAVMTCISSALGSAVACCPCLKDKINEECQRYFDYT